MNSRILYILLFLFVSDILASYGRNYGNRSTGQGGFGKISSSAYVRKSQPISAAERYKLIKQQMSSFTSNTPTDTKTSYGSSIKSYSSVSQYKPSGSTSQTNSRVSGKRSSYSGTSSSVSSTSNHGNGRSRFSGRSSYNGRSSFNGLSSNSGWSSRHGQTKSSISSNVNKGSTSSSTNTHNLSPAERYKLSKQSQGSSSRYGSSLSSNSPNNGRSSSFGKSQFPSSSFNINKGSTSSSTNTHNLSPAERYKLSKQSQGSSSRYGSRLSSYSLSNGRSSSFGRSLFPSSSSNINKGSTSSSTNTHNLSPAERYKLSKQSQGSSSRYGSSLSSNSLSNGRSSSFGKSQFPSSSSNINKGSTSSSTNTHNLSPAERYKLSKQSQGSSSRFGSSLSSNSPSNGRSSSFGKSLFPSSSFSVNKGSTSSSTNTHNLSPAERYKLSKQSQGSSSRYGSSLSSNSPNNGRPNSFGKSKFPSSSSIINKGSTSSSTNTHNLSPAERYKLSKQSQGSSSRYGSSLSSSSLNNGRSSSFGRSQFPSSSSNGAVSSSSSQKTKSKHTSNLFDQYNLSQLNQQKTTISSTVANSRNFGFGSKQNSNWLQNSGIITTTPVSKEGFGVVSAGVNKELLSGNTHNLSPLERLKLLRQSTENDLTEFRKCLDCIPKDSQLNNSQNNGRNYVATTPKSFVYTPIKSTSKSADMKNFLSHSGSASLTASSSNTHTQVKTNGVLQLDNTHVYNPVDRLKKMREQNGQSVPGSVCLDCETPPKKNDNNKAQDNKVQDNGDDNKIKDNIPTDKNIKSPWKAMADETTTLAVETSKPGTWGSDICSPNPCKNGGTCKIDSYNPKEFECACPLKYRGKFCHEVTVKCDILGCNVTEECISTPAGGVCTCVVNGVVENCLIDTALKSDWDKIKMVVSKETVHGVEGIVFGVVLALLLFIFLVIHCYRVNSKRSIMNEKYKNAVKKGETSVELPPGWCDVSDRLLKQAFCCKKGSIVDEYQPVKVSKEKKKKKKKDRRRDSTHDDQDFDINDLPHPEQIDDEINNRNHNLSANNVRILNTMNSCSFASDSLSDNRDLFYEHLGSIGDFKHLTKKDQKINPFTLNKEKDDLFTLQKLHSLYHSQYDEYYDGDGEVDTSKDSDDIENNISFTNKCKDNKSYHRTDEFTNERTSLVGKSQCIQTSCNENDNGNKMERKFENLRSERTSLPNIKREMSNFDSGNRPMLSPILEGTNTAYLKRYSNDSDCSDEQLDEKHNFCNKNANVSGTEQMLNTESSYYASTTPSLYPTLTLPCNSTQHQSTSHPTNHETTCNYNSSKSSSGKLPSKANEMLFSALHSGIKKYDENLQKINVDKTNSLLDDTNGVSNDNLLTSNSSAVVSQKECVQAESDSTKNDNEMCSVILEDNQLYNRPDNELYGVWSTSITIPANVTTKQLNNLVDKPESVDPESNNNGTLSVPNDDDRSSETLYLKSFEKDGQKLYYVYHDPDGDQYNYNQNYSLSENDRMHTQEKCQNDIQENDQIDVHENDQIDIQENGQNDIQENDQIDFQENGQIDINRNGQIDIQGHYIVNNEDDTEIDTDYYNIVSDSSHTLIASANDSETSDFDETLVCSPYDSEV